VNRRPPGRTSLLWCPACGATRQAGPEYWALPGGDVHVSDSGGTCLVQRELLTYVLPHAPEPLPAFADGSIRAAVAVEVAIRPGLPHLGGGTLSFVGRTIQYQANTVEHLAELAGLTLREVAETLPDSIAEHPRPKPERWMPR
jgi:hypothetical protein